jgi:hypothetical protein
MFAAEPASTTGSAKQGIVPEHDIQDIKYVQSKKE